MARKLKLTDTTIKRLPDPDDRGKVTTYRDSELRGFGLLVKANGNKVFICWRGTTRRTIERAELMKAEDARDQAVEWLKVIKREGRSFKPNKTPAPRTGTLTVGQLLDKYIETKKTLAPASISLYRGLFNTHLKPWLNTSVADITPAMVIEKHKAIRDGAETPKQDGKTVADLTMRVFRAVWAFALAIETPGLPSANPVTRLDTIGGWYLDGPRKRTVHIPEGDLHKFWQCLSDAAPEQVNARLAMLLRLLLLTGLRVGCAKRLKVPDHVDLANRVIKIPGPMMKGKRDFEIPIVDGLHDLLTAYLEDQGIEAGYLFPSVIIGKSIVEVRPAFNYIKERTGLELTPHCLRRTFARCAKRAGVNRWQAAELLAHAGGTLTDDYAGTSNADDLREPLQRVTAYILSKCGGNVIVLPTKGRRKKAA